MLKNVKVRNFQNHKDSTLSFSPGVNIISGSSDNGKSALFRAIGLGLTNRPSGYGYKPFTAKKKDITEVTLEFDDGTATRRKSDTIDEYQLNDEEPLKALNRQVPDEVVSLINLGDYSFQEQHEGHFFIAKTGGERAKMLNEIAGLEIIDQSLSNINSAIRENGSNIEKSKKEIKSLDAKLKEIEFVTEANDQLIYIKALFTEIEQLSKMNVELQQLQSHLEQLDQFVSEREQFLKIKIYIPDLIQRIQVAEKIRIENGELTIYKDNISELSEIIDSNKVFLESKPSLLTVLQKIQSHKVLKEEAESVQNYLDKLSEVSESIKETTEWLRCKESYSSISSKLIVLKGVQEKGTSLLEWSQSFNYGNARAQELGIKVSCSKKKRDEYITKFKICPFCGSKK